MVKKNKAVQEPASTVDKKNTSKTPDVPDVLKKPSSKQLVGGSSWTGKLPTALLHEFCQKQGWLKPDYGLSHRSGQYTVTNATLSKKNPKNSEIEAVSLRPTKEELEVMPSKDLAVEARNIAATWCLHRVGHKLNFSMQMPPDHRQMWNSLEKIRKEDCKNGKDFLYDLDPFKNAKDHKVEVVKWEKEREKKEETKQTTVAHGRHDAPWKNVPQVEMSKELRRQIESVIGSLHLEMSDPASPANRDQITSALVALGFRKRHAHEACDHASNVEKALEFLLLFTPEDDLPHRFLPPSYSTGLTGSSHDTESLQLDYAARRLHSAGYALPLCQQIMNIAINEELAAEILQAGLLDMPADLRTAGLTQSEWMDELASLEAIYADSYHSSKHTSEVFLSLPTKTEYRLHFRPPTSGLYPEVLPTFYVSHATQTLPAYIKLALIKDLGEYAKTLTGQPMIFLLLEHLDDHILEVIENPGNLLDLAGTVVGSTAVSRAPQSARKQGLKRKRRQIDWTPNSEVSQSLKAKRDAILQTSAHIKKLEARNRLPAARQRDAIIDILQHDQCLVISGETGSGKSTQVVQYVLDALIDSGHGEQCKIICTQPRRISALGLADRVGDERSNTGEVGYAIRGDSKQGPNTKISFVTTGVLLRRLTVSGDAGLDGVTHVFVDEVHERSIDSDFLLISLRELLRSRKDLKVILMSATVEAELFCKYLGGAQHLHIEGRTFPVEDYYLEDMHFLHQGEDRREKTRNGVDYDLIASIVEQIDRDLGSANSGGILIFLPGTLEISRTLQEIDRRSGGRFHTLPLHASLPAAQQKKVFLRSPNRRKIIAATNVAETSITIDDIVAVIDTGRVKQMNYDPQANVTKFEEVWCSKAACKQRRGRAGRVAAGKCYKTFTRALEAAKMAENTAPEIIRTPLEQVVLSALAMNKDGRHFLSKAVTVPDQRSLDSAITLLRQVGAIDEEERLTPLGRLMAIIPADLKCSKLLILASIFGVLDRALVVAACLSSKSPFFPGPESGEKKSAFAGHDGDVFCDTRAYEAWNALAGFRERRAWCEEHGCSDSVMQEIRSTASQYLDSLKEAGLVPSSARKFESLSLDGAGNGNDRSEDALLKSIIASALSPNVARIQFPDRKYASTMGGALERDHDSKTIKFYTAESRLFLHPSSTLFAENAYKDAHFLSFWQATMTSKLFIRGVTPNGMYGQLLLGRSLALDPHGRGLLLDGWIRVAAWPKIAVFVSLMRRFIEDILEAKIDDPSVVPNEDILCIMRSLISS